MMPTPTPTPTPGTEIAADAAKQAYTPRYISHVGEGDARLTLWECGAGLDTRAIDTNGGAVWEESSPDDFSALLAQMDKARAMVDDDDA